MTPTHVPPKTPDPDCPKCKGEGTYDDPPLAVQEQEAREGKRTFMCKRPCDCYGEKWRAAHYKVPEGYKLTSWPRFKALMTRLGVAVPPNTNRVRIDYPAGDEEVLVNLDGLTIRTGYAGNEAFHFRESWAYFELLGIPVHQWVISLTIEFATGEFPKYTMTAALAVPDHLDPEKD